jgi:hypothetical protein
MLSFDLHVFRSERDARNLLRCQVAMRTLPTFFCFWRDWDMGHKGFRVCQSFPESFPGRFGQPQELMESDSGWDVGQLGHNIKAEGNW